MSHRYDLVDVNSGERIKGVLGTPMLISEATKPGARIDAYRMEDEPDSRYPDGINPRYPGGIWRARDDGYDQRHGVTPDQYRTVRMQVWEEEW